ncbi:MAG: type II toxin-antitoxin system VapC family toxin [Ktedonobacteraceae bacterium]
MVVGKRRLFVDTSGWIEVFGKNNPFHEKAKHILIQAMRERRPIITTNYVITEFVGRGGKACRLPRKELLEATREISNLPGIEVIFIGEENHAVAISFLRGRLDKEWSLVDATSFNVMTQRGIHEALATDLDFVQAGFIKLL